MKVTNVTLYLIEEIFLCNKEKLLWNLLPNINGSLWAFQLELWQGMLIGTSSDVLLALAPFNLIGTQAHFMAV
ncbi:MAG: hypothetical protein HQ522_15660 [Bacteroidetes bacterium]|nr:hypothetical protein [Bacteroidota bacterium]